jgi:hypothetical protein
MLNFRAGKHAISDHDANTRSVRWKPRLKRRSVVHAGRSGLPKLFAPTLYLAHSTAFNSSMWSPSTLFQDLHDFRRQLILLMRLADPWQVDT